MRFVVQDLQENVDRGREAAERSLPPEVAARVSFQPHDFMKQQPIRGADAYLLRMIMHDWPDEAAKAILSNIAAAMEAAKSRLFVMDTVLPEPGSVPVSLERIARARDLTMLQSFNSKERELGEWSALITSVRPALKIVQIRQPIGSAMSVIEICLA